MVEEDVLLDEQIKKKKRLVLLALLSLLLVTTLAALPWLQQPPSPATAIAERESPSPTSTPVSGVMPETSPASSKTAIPRAITPTLPSIDQTTSPPELTPNPTLKATSSAKPTEPGDTATPVATASAAETANRKTPTATNAPPEVRGDEWPGVDTPPAGASVQPASVEATKKSPRYDGPEIADLPSRGSPVPTSILTRSAQLTNTSAIVPPDGLPVTGKNLPRKVNWVALGMMVLLLGAGVAALLRPGVEQNT